MSHLLHKAQKQRSYDNNRSSELHVMFMKDNLIKIFEKYGFIECADILLFLEICCTTYPDRIAYTYIENKLLQCLKNHDNGSDYFFELKTLADNLKELLATQDL